MENGFVKWTVRTLDVDAARTFYDHLLEEGAGDISELPAHIRARGAKPHWLGHLVTPEPPSTIEAFVARGATQLSGKEILRDPGGAVFALTPIGTRSRRDVVFQLLLTPDLERTKKDYSDLFHMELGTSLELPPHGTYHQFGWGVDEVSGLIGDITGKPHIHPQWLYFFRTADLEEAISYVRTSGGIVIGPTTLPDGRRMAVCDDPQGAAFGLMEGPPDPARAAPGCP